MEKRRQQRKIKERWRIRQRNLCLVSGDGSVTSSPFNIWTHLVLFEVRQGQLLFPPPKSVRKPLREKVSVRKSAAESNLPAAVSP
jgi:hypothetical protein